MEEETRWEVNYKRVTVKMSDGLLYTGKMNIRNFNRLSDFFRGAEDHFLIVLSESEGSQKVMMLSKNFIVWAEAID